MNPVKDNREEVIVYWSPAYFLTSNTGDPDWNLLYNNPKNVFEDLRKNRNKEAKDDSFIYCPAVRSNFENTFMFTNSVSTEFNYNKASEELVPVNDTYLHGRLVRGNSLVDSLLLRLALEWIFFCEEDISIFVSAPYFHKTEHLKHGAIVPGTYNIAKWFRSVNAEFSLWPNENYFNIPTNDPIFYARFNTDKKVVLKRFKMNEDLGKIQAACSNTASVFGKFKSLEEKYNIFENTSTDNIVIKLIKETLI